MIYLSFIISVIGQGAEMMLLSWLNFENIVLEQAKKYHWSPVILTILKFNERVPYHERLQVSKFSIFGQLEFLKICAAFLNFAQTRFL